MANTYLAYPDLALDKFSGTDPDQDAASFMQLIERKISFALGDAAGDADELAHYTFRKKALFFTLRTSCRVVREHYERYYMGELQNKIFNSILGRTKQFSTQNGSGTWYQRRWRRHSELSTPYQKDG